MSPRARREDQWLRTLFESSAGASWLLREDGYDPLLERDRESRLAIGNGLIGVRASLELPTRASRPRTYVAGIYDAANGDPSGVALVPIPDWLRLVVAVDGHELHVRTHQTRSRVLDMATGILRSDAIHELPSGKSLRLSTVRIVSQHERTVALQVVRLITEHAGEVTLTAHLVPSSLALILEGADDSTSVWRTARSGRRVRVAMDAELSLPGDGPLRAQQERALARRWKWQAKPGGAATLVRTVTFVKLNRPDVQTPRQTPVTRTDHAEAIVNASNASWVERWRTAAITVEGDDEADRALRFAAYQLLSAANPDDDRNSVGARGLTGDAYSGHVFWDTEIFLLPFYTLSWPEAARAMLMYRYHTLPAARAKAARLGYRGALYAWESADTGEETTPPSVELPNGETMQILGGLIEDHISADIAFAVHQYWQVTGDDHFLLRAGAEILLETARFWASRVTLEDDGLYHIRDVIGPDEYHERVDDNAYTNGMAQWNIQVALDVADRIGGRWPERWKELRAALDLGDDELARWSDVAARLYTGFDPKSGLFEQFQGFFDLEPIDLASYEPRNVPIDMLIGRERTARSQAIKQADVLMLISLLWDRFTPDVRSKNFRYYEPRCAHGSSLSPGVHALVAARLGELSTADAYFRETQSIDLGDTMGNLAGGVHMAALGSLWQAVVFGYAGLSLQSDGISFDPKLPRRWTSLTFTLRWRDNALRVAISPSRSTFDATMLEGTCVNVAVNGVAHELHEGEQRAWQLAPSIAELEAAP